MTVVRNNTFEGEKMFRSNLLSTAISAAGLTLLPFSIFAESGVEQQPQKLTHENNLKDIEIIEVYAQKRKQNINQVTVAVSVLDGDAIARQQLKDTTQLAGLVPNVKMTNNAGEGTPPAFNIRGVGMIDYNTSTISPIAVYSDDIVSAHRAFNQVARAISIKRMKTF